MVLQEEQAAVVPNVKVKFMPVFVLVTYCLGDEKSDGRHVGEGGDVSDPRAQDRSPEQEVGEIKSGFTIERERKSAETEKTTGSCKAEEDPVIEQVRLAWMLSRYVVVMVFSLRRIQDARGKANK
jgi:hypothetical protein